MSAFRSSVAAKLISQNVPRDIALSIASVSQSVSIVSTKLANKIINNTPFSVTSVLEKDSNTAASLAAFAAKSGNKYLQVVVAALQLQIVSLQNEANVLASVSDSTLNAIRPLILYQFVLFTNSTSYFMSCNNAKSLALATQSAEALALIAAKTSYPIIDVIAETAQASCAALQSVFSLN
jgi:hypothetical protein